MIKFYLHLPELPGWQNVFAEMLGKMESSGLLEAADEVNFCVNGVASTVEMTLLPLLLSNSKFRMVQVNGDATKWEWPTINKLKEDADTHESEDFIGYAHLKALSRPDVNDPKGVDWRHYLTYWTIERWADAVAKLEEGNELVGVNWTEATWPHMSGNFWWARSNYLRRLPKLQDPSTIEPGTVSKLLKPNITLDPGNVRFECEAWVGQGSPKVFVQHQSHLPADPAFHYNNQYPAKNYRID